MVEPGSWERRWHPLLREWVVVAATTGDRPWSGVRVDSSANQLPEHDPACYLCPGVVRASGVRNPRYTKLFAYDNDFPSLSLQAPTVNQDDLLQRIAPARGICRVVCFSPRHNLSLGEMDSFELDGVVRFWAEEYRALGALELIRHVLIFVNTGLAIGVSNPHPHGQIYATDFVPQAVERRLDAFVQYRQTTRTCLLCDLARREREQGLRVVAHNDHFVAFVPFFARFAFEVCVVPDRHTSDIAGLSTDEIRSLAEILRMILAKYDNLFHTQFPNVMVMQNAPTDGSGRNSEFHFHVEFYPPMRDPDKLKHYGGFEYGGGNIINPVQPEAAAARLQQAEEIHYKRR